MKARQPLIALFAVTCAASACVAKPTAPAQAPAATPSQAQPPPAPRGPGQVVTSAAEPIYAFSLQGDATRGSMRIVPTQGQSFSHVLRAETSSGGGDPWSLQVGARTSRTVDKGDVLLATFWLRCVSASTGQCKTEMVLEQARDPWTKLVAVPATFGSEWMKFEVPFVAADDYPAGTAQALFRMGYDPQVFEIGGFAIESFAKTKGVDELPSTNAPPPPAPAEGEPAAN